MPRGGARKGAGRKTLAENLQTADLARECLIKRWGSLEAALSALLDYEEPTLTRFVFEHAFGKSPDKIEHSGKVDMQITGMEIVTGQADKK